MKNFISEIKTRGVRFSLDLGTVHVEGAELLTDAERAMLKEQKPFLIRLLGFRQVIRAWQADGHASWPLLVLPNAPEHVPGACLSGCGSEVERGHFRCALCVEAGDAAMGMETERRE